MLGKPLRACPIECAQRTRPLSSGPLQSSSERLATQTPVFKAGTFFRRPGGRRCRSSTGRHESVAYRPWGVCDARRTRTIAVQRADEQADRLPAASPATALNSFATRRPIAAPSTLAAVSGLRENETASRVSRLSR